ncbi:preprotein translocase subunit SecG [Paraurantiacibacter namhicola]|uniref:preprotein translocase subunit SecG n=1 Tax=Paraurantiacibacter namhicola TaxID=645517 RepID=UPI00082A366C|nr:preprotein translocase subunit SecG [Paraurantiacibacter namhicola]
MFLFLTVLQGLIAAALVGTILMQRSEGGGLGIGGGGSPGGMLSARGAADFLSRATKWLAVTFVALSIVMASIAVNQNSARTIDDTLDRSVVPANTQQAPDLIPGDPGLDGEAPVDPAPAADPNDPLAGV